MRQILRCKNLHLSGIDVLLPALVSIDGHHPSNARQVQIAISFAQGHVQNIVAALVAHWLEETCDRRFAEDERCVEGDLAATVFYDKLNTCFDDDSTFVAALMFPKHPAPAMLGFDLEAASADKAASWAARCGRGGRVFSRFMNGSELARWIFSGRVRAYLNPPAGAVQVAFEELPGGIAFESKSRSVRAPRVIEHVRQMTAWYGFGSLIRPPAAAIATLRDAIAAKSSRAKAPAVHHV